MILKPYYNSRQIFAPYFAALHTTQRFDSLALRKRYDLIIKKFKVVNFEVFKEKFISGKDNTIVYGDKTNIV